MADEYSLKEYREFTRMANLASDSTILQDYIDRLDKDNELSRHLLIEMTKELAMLGQMHEIEIELDYRAKKINYKSQDMGFWTKGNKELSEYLQRLKTTYKFRYG